MSNSRGWPGATTRWPSSSTNNLQLRAAAELERRRRVVAGDAPPRLAGFVELTATMQLESWQQMVCGRLERMLGETGQRVLIHGPPQFGKSMIVSQRLPAYAILKRPAIRVRLACYNVSHSERFSRVNQSLLRDPVVVRAFPDEGARLPPVVRVEEWSTTARLALRDANPSFVALGLGTGFTGLGVDLLIIDDPYKNAQEARSAAVNVMLWDWWTQVVMGRLNPEANVVVMFHRWWEGDFAGRLIEQGGWEVLRFPAIADGEADDPTGRAAGVPLSPRYSVAYLDELRRTMGTAFEALYQGRPYPAEGGLFKSGKVLFVDAIPRDADRVRYWDKAGAAPGKGDYTVGVLLARTPDGFWWIEDVVRGQWPAHERNPTIVETAERDRQRYGDVPIVIEQPPGLAKEATDTIVRLLAGHAVRADPVHRDKAERAEPFAAQWNAGNVRMQRATWNEAYLTELFAFPNGLHDDQVDASSGAFNDLAPHGPAVAPVVGGSRPAIATLKVR